MAVSLLTLEQNVLNVLNEAYNSTLGDLPSGTGAAATIATLTPASSSIASTIKSLLNEGAAEIARTCYPVADTATLAWAAGLRSALVTSFTAAAQASLWTVRGAKWIYASGTDLVVDGSNNLKVTSASYNFVTGDVGSVVEITAGSSWTKETTTIGSISGTAAILALSPAATGVTGGTWNLSAGSLTYTERSALERANPSWLTAATSTPQYWYQNGENIGVYPRPSAAGTLKVDGFAVPTALTSDTSDTSSWLIDDLTHLMVWYAAFKLATKNLEDGSLASRVKIWQQFYDQGRDDLWLKLDPRIRKAHFPTRPMQPAS